MTFPTKARLALAAVVLLFLLLFSSVYVAHETQQCFITQFGRPIGEPVTTPGLHFKLPFIHKAHFFSRQFLEWDGNPEEITTKDKKFIQIDSYARWRIDDPLKFFQDVTDERGAQTRLDTSLEGATRRVIADNNLVEIVRSLQREASGEIEETAAEIQLLEPFEYGRLNISQEIIKAARPSLEKAGIDLLDFRFKRIMYGPKVQEEIFNRMTAERRRIADKFRSEGEGQAQKINGERERELKTIQSDAYRQAQEIQGQADAEAIKIYADSYNRDAAARAFYEFLKTMETYEASFSEKDSLILSTDTDLYRFFKASSDIDSAAAAE